MGWLRQSLGLLRSFVFTIPLIYTYTVVLGLVSWLVSPFDPGGRLQHRCAQTWSRLILATSLIRVRVRGLENLDGGKHYVFVANHQSYMDIPIVFGYFPEGFRILAKASLFSIPFLGWHLRRTGNMPIGRRNVRANARRLLQAVNYIREGHSIVVFPEGGRSVGGGIEEFRTGVFLAAIKVGAPVVPVAIAGSRHVLGRNSWHIRPGQVELIFTSPIETESMHRGELEELVSQVHQRIEKTFLGGSV